MVLTLTRLAVITEPYRDEDLSRLIYFVQSDRGGPIKIGFTEDFIQRFRCLQLGSPFRLKAIGFRSGDRSEESRLHRKFSQYRLWGEWFYPGRRLRTYVEKQTVLDPAEEYGGRISKSTYFLFTVDKSILELFSKVRSRFGGKSRFVRKAVDLLIEESESNGGIIPYKYRLSYCGNVIGVTKPIGIEFNRRSMGRLRHLSSENGKTLASCIRASIRYFGSKIEEVDDLGEGFDI